MNTLHLFLVFLLTTSLLSVATTRVLEPFTKVKVCVPYTVQITTSGGDELYSVELDGDDNFQSALNSKVSDSELVLSSTGVFKTSNPVKLTVKLPGNKLASIFANTVGDVVVSGAFSVPMLVIFVNNTQNLYGPNLEVTEKLDIQNTGVGQVALGGQLKGDIALTMKSTAQVFLTGVSGDVVVDGTDVSFLHVSPVEDSVTISGSLLGPGKVFYTGGQCNIPDSFPFQICEKASKLEKPDFVPNLRWSCNADVKSDITCEAGGQYVISSECSTTGTSLTIPMV